MFRPSLVALTGALLLAAPVHADARLHERPMVVPPSAQAAVARTPVATSSVPVPTTAPPATSAGRMTLISSQIDIMTELVAAIDADDPELPDLLYRLAGLYAQSADFWRHKAMSASNRNTPRAKFERKAEAAEKEALGHYRRIVQNPAWARYPRLDEVLFDFASALQQAGAVKDARKVFMELIKNHPSSARIPDAYLAFAEYYFTSGAMTNAAKFYEQVLKYPKAGVYHYAQYKLGWVHINMGRSKAALERFYAVGRATGARNQALARQARSDFVRVYADIGRPAVAYAAFRRLDVTDAPRMMNALARTYADQGKAKEAMATYRSLIVRSRKGDPQVCAWQLGIAQSAISVGKDQDIVAELEKAAQVAARLGSPGCRDDVARVMSPLIRHWHQEAAHTRRPARLEPVDALYQAHLQHLLEAADRSEMRYYYAEWSWHRAAQAGTGRRAQDLWRRAARQFQRVVDDDEADPGQRAEAREAAQQARANRETLQRR